MSTAMLRRRIKSVKGTQQITGAMKTAATSKYSKVSALAAAFEPYMEQCGSIKAAFAGSDAVQMADGAVCYVFISGSRGMCGQYNYSAMRLLESTLENEKRPYRLIACGKWGAENLKKSKYASKLEVIDTGDVPDRMRAADIADRLLEMYRAGEAAEICFVYNKFKNVLVQTPVTERLLPEAGAAAEETEDEYIFVPDKNEILKNLETLFVRARVYSILLSAAQGFYGASLTAMRTASDNSEQMLEKLDRELNRSRQGEITTEVLELAAGVHRGE